MEFWGFEGRGTRLPGDGFGLFVDVAVTYQGKDGLTQTKEIKNLSVNKGDNDKIDEQEVQQALAANKDFLAALMDDTDGKIEVKWKDGKEDDNFKWDASKLKTSKEGDASKGDDRALTTKEDALKSVARELGVDSSKLKHADKDSFDALLGEVEKKIRGSKEVLTSDASSLGVAALNLDTATAAEVDTAVTTAKGTKPTKADAAYDAKVAKLDAFSTAAKAFIAQRDTIKTNLAAVRDPSVSALFSSIADRKSSSGDKQGLDALGDKSNKAAKSGEVSAASSGGFSFNFGPGGIGFSYGSASANGSGPVAASNMVGGGGTPFGGYGMGGGVGGGGFMGGASSVGGFGQGFGGGTGFDGGLGFGNFLQTFGQTSDLKSQARKMEMMLEQLLHSLMGGNVDAISSILNLEAGRAKITLIGAAYMMVKAMKSYQTQQDETVAKMEKLVGDGMSAGNAQNQFQTMQNKMNEYSMTRQMIVNNLRDVKTMEEEIENQAKSYYDVKGQHLRGLSHWNA